MSDLSQITAVILAGGLGKRLREVVPDIPKVMAEINGKPFITYLLDQLAEVFIERVIISTGYKAEIIEEIVGTSYKDIQIDYSREGSPLGTGGALRLASQAVATKHCLVMNGDCYTEFNLNSLLLSHEQKTANITLLVKTIDDTSRFGNIQINEENEIIEFIEKKRTEKSGIINAGVYLINTSVLEKITKKTPCSLEYDFFPNMIGKGIYGYETRSKFIDIGIPESYAKAKTFFEKKPISV